MIRKRLSGLQNAQIRVDVAQKKGIIQLIEAMSDTIVGGMRSVQIAKEYKTRTPTGALPPKKATPTVQNISVSSDAAWQKMQNIPLPGGEGRWALSLEAQKKDSLFCKILQDVVKQGGLFAPMIGLPGITMSALQSFNLLYGAIHAQPVQVIQSNPLRVFATKDAYQNTGSPGSGHRDPAAKRDVHFDSIRAVTDIRPIERPRGDAGPSGSCEYLTESQTPGPR